MLHSRHCLSALLGLHFVHTMASLEDRISAPEGEKPAEDWATESGQMDGATEFQGGGGGSDLLQSNYDVEVKLIDENSPLFSVKSFDELGL